MPNELAEAAANFLPGAPRSLHQQPGAEQRQPKASASEVVDDRLKQRWRCRRWPKTSVSTRYTPLPQHAGGRHERDAPPAVQVPAGERAQLVEVPPASAPATTYAASGVDPVALPAPFRNCAMSPLPLRPTL